MKVLPVLDISATDTWLNAPLAKGRRLLANYFLTDRWQSHAYEDTVFSAVDVLLEYTEEEDEAAMVAKVTESLTSLFKLHFDRADVLVNLVSDTRVLDVGVTWYVGNTPYTFSNYVGIADVLSTVTNFHNTGNINGN